jgi:hypothetical protein
MIPRNCDFQQYLELQNAAVFVMASRRHSWLNRGAVKTTNQQRKIQYEQNSA